MSDTVELQLTVLAGIARDAVRVLTANTQVSPTEYTFEPNDLYAVAFDPLNPFTNETAEGPVPDLDEAEAFLEHLEEDVLLLTVTSDREDAFLEDLVSGLEFLENALVTEPWQVDFDAVAADMGVSRDDAELAVGLFNAYCARCHTGGYSAGPAFEQGAGSGAWAPALWDGRSLIQFPDVDDQINFIITGSENAVGYGVNGIGSGRMPGFGGVLSTEQINLIVQYERSM